MKKSNKLIFIISLLVMFTVLTGGVMSIYDNVTTNNKRDNLNISNNFSRKMLYFMFDQAKQADENYEPLTFSNEVPQKIRLELTYALQEQMLEARSLLAADSNFNYEIKNKETGKTIQSQNKVSDKNAFLYSKMSYDGSGKLTCDGDYISTDFAYTSIYQILRYYVDIDPSYDNKQDYYINGVLITAGQIQVNMPKNIEVIYSIPENISANDGYVSMELLDNDYYIMIFSVSCAAIAVIIGIFMLIYPIGIAANVNPYAFSTKIKAGVKWLALGLLTGIMVVGTIIISSYTVSGNIPAELKSAGIPYADNIVFVLNICAWLFTELLFSLCWFELKYIFANGFIRYIKQDTIVGSLCGWLAKKFDKLTDVDLSKPIEKNLGKCILANTVVIVVLGCMWWFGAFLAIVYGIISFYYLLDKAKKIQQDYIVLQSAAHELTEGNFDGIMPKETGCFAQLGKEFANIKTGFKKAVDEEVKSQNMKTELITNVSHDLKTPVTGIKNYVELLEEDGLSEEKRKEYAGVLNRYVDRLSSLIEDLFDVSKANSGNVELDIMELNIVALAEQAYAETEEELKAKNLTVMMKGTEQPILLNLDGNKTYRIFENLFINISKYAMPNTRVYVDFEKMEQQVKICFKNISEAEMDFNPEQITERFVRGDSSRHEIGSGLGLAIVKSFTEIQGGDFHIEIDGDLFKAVLKFAYNQ